MNWMGGARNRVKYQGERRIQQEFFERQKLAAAQSFSRKTLAQKKRGLSQDLIALHTVSRVHSGVSDGTKRRPIKKVDLEKFRSCTRHIDEVDMGPCSPSQTPSKLLLNDGRKSGCVKSTNADPALSRELFPKSEHIHRNCIHKNKYKDNTDSEQAEQSWKNSLKTFSITVENKDKPADAYIIHKQPNEFSFSKPKPDGHHVKNAVKAKFDPYVSEDFQVTPLVRYTKKRSPENIEFEKFKKKKHSVGTTIRKDNVSGTTEKKRNHCIKEPYLSSTPVTDLHGVKSDKNKNQEDFGGISPIIKGTAFSKDVESGFRFKPRPMIVAKKGDKFSTSQCVVQEKNMQELSMQGNESFKDFSSQREIYEYNHGKLSKSSNKLKHYTRTPMSRTHERLNSQSEQFDSLSKYDLTENMFNNSLSGDSLMQGAEEEISGALVKYRNIFRHKSDQESPILQGHMDSVTEQDKVSKIPADNRSKIGISKPKFSDVEEEFQYKPMKAGSVKIIPKIMNTYQKFDNGNETEIGTGSRISHMSDNTRKVSRRLSHHSVQRIPSPVPADEFPEHLLSPSKQLQDEIDQKLLEIIADERKNGLGTFIGRQIESSLQDNGASSYKPLKTGMSDVLNEMNQLEEENSMSADVPLEQTLKYTENSAGAVTTESFEADAYLESEDILLNADIEYMQDLGEMSNMHKSTAVEKDLIVIGCQTENEEASRFKDEIEVENETDVTLGKTLEAHTNVDVTVDRALDACLENREMIDKSESGSINHNYSSQVNDVRSQDMETGKSNEQGSKISRDISKVDEGNLEKKNVTDINCKNIDKGSKDIDSKLNTVEELKSFENNSTNVEMCCVAHKSRTIGTGKSAQLQVPEISSGKNQFTQTVAKSCPQKYYVEVATSPFHGLNTVQELSDFGVQCDLASFPTLSCLAGKCFKVEPARNFTSSLHKTAEEGDVSNNTDLQDHLILESI